MGYQECNPLAAIHIALKDNVAETIEKWTPNPAKVRRAVTKLCDHPKSKMSCACLSVVGWVR